MSRRPAALAILLPLDPSDPADARDLSILVLYLELRSARKVAERLDVSRNTVRAALDRASILLKRWNPAFEIGPEVI
jgi:hypothetical protein